MFTPSLMLLSKPTSTTPRDPDLNRRKLREQRFCLPSPFPVSPCSKGQIPRGSHARLPPGDERPGALPEVTSPGGRVNSHSSKGQRGAGIVVLCPHDLRLFIQAGWDGATA